ncbi:hypothetical protein [Streptomyces sp. NPDC007000]|uniref:hypothetical protein n=1 Tax=unclassified Streptomyces TaxID=2593676 RepID=UPI00159F21C3
MQEGGVVLLCGLALHVGGALEGQRADQPRQTRNPSVSRRSARADASPGALCAAPLERIAS